MPTEPILLKLWKNAKFVFKDVFDNPPGSNGYSPLRRLNVITWAEGISAREVKSVTEVMEAEASGELAIEQPGVVINMPFVVWDGGQR